MMTQKERAKQFSSFDSLKGLDKALQNREEYMEKNEGRTVNGAHKSDGKKRDNAHKRSR